MLTRDELVKIMVDIMPELCQDGRAWSLADRIIALLDKQVQDAGSEMILRELLWLRHGCDFSALYGDDGEMQCHSCKIDFKRIPADKMKERFIQLGEEVIAGLAVKP